MTKGLKRKLHTKSRRIRVVVFIHFTLFFPFSFLPVCITHPQKSRFFSCKTEEQIVKAETSEDKKKKTAHFVVKTRSKYHFRLRGHSSATPDPCTTSSIIVSAHRNAEHRELESLGMPVLPKGSFHTLWCSLWVSLGIGRCVSCRPSTYK